MGTNSSTTNQYQSSQFNPYGITVPGLTNLANQLTSMSGNTGLTANQNTGLNSLWSGASAIPTNMGSQATGVVNNLLNTNTTQPQNILTGGYGTTQNTLSPYLSAGYTNPMNTPGFSTALNTLNTCITNQINSEFAAAGREGSPDNTQALARGLSQGEGGLISSEFNTLSGNQLSAANLNQNAATNTSSLLAQLQQQPYANQLSAVSAMAGIPGLYTGAGTSQLGAANAAYSQPYSNTQQPLTQLAAMAGLGGTSSGYGTSTTSQPMNPYTTALGATMGLGALGKSDRRLKTDIKRVGRLDNDLPVYSFRYKADPDRRVQLGVMAQDVEKSNPGAVVDIGLWRGGPSFKAVDYEKATAMAA